MIHEISRLKEELARVKAWDETKKRYQLISPTPGSFVYALKEESKGTEPPHWICATCYEDGRKSILQQLGEFYGVMRYICPHCKNEYRS
jgi:hypothetical protein